MKTRVKQHIYVVVFWLMAKYLFSLYYSAAIVNQFHMSLYNSADSHGWVTHIFKVIAHMFKMLCVSLLSTWQIITRCRCVVWKSEPGETVGESPPNQKETRDWQIFNCSPNAKQLQLSPWEEEEEHENISILQVVDASWWNGNLLSPKMTVQPKNPRVCLRAMAVSRLLFWPGKKKEKKNYILHFLGALSLSV